MSVRNLTIGFSLLVLSVFSTHACSDRQDFFPNTSSTWYFFENDKIIKKLSKETKEAEALVLKNIERSDWRKSIARHLKKSNELAMLECQIYGNTSLAGGHWPGVWEGECRILFLKKNIAALRRAGECLKKIDSIPNQCISNIFQTMSISDLEN